jgi:hypothetical protein
VEQQDPIGFVTDSLWLPVIVILKGKKEDIPADTLFKN